MTEKLLTVNNLSTYLQTKKQFVKAVDGVSFSIDKGETFCLVGESGSGKSVTALSIMQLLPQDIATHPSGEILLSYKNDESKLVQSNIMTTSEDALRKLRGSRMTMIFQEPMNSLNPVYTIGEQIIEALKIHNPKASDKENREKALYALEQVMIPEPHHRIDDYSHRLSGGQRQRVMIAMAMACEPDLLIADEPTTALDVTIQAEILDLMAELQQKNNMGILFITHDLGVVSNIADTLGVMKLGKLVEQGNAKEVLRNPQHDYTKQLLAALPENLTKYARKDNRSQHSESNTNDNILSINDLKIYFPIKKGVFRHTVDHVKAVDGVSLDIKKGNITALVGESGSGKSTFGRALLRLEDLTSGSIKFEGNEISQLKEKELKPLRKKLQFIFQDPMSSLNPRLRIVTTLTEPMAVHGIGRNEEERIALAENILQRVQLKAEHLWRYPHEFSGGQRQRIGIARSLALNPSFIVCDEITSALDVSVQAEILQLLLELRDDFDLTLLFITHNISVVEFLSDDIAVMKQGKIVEYGKTSEVTGTPTHAYTTELLNAVPRLVL